MTSNYIKTCLFHKFRFMQRIPYLASEVGSFSADMATICNGKLTEYEVKLSLSDFKADFKKQKHKFYAQAAQRDGVERGDAWIPHFFYFVVTPELVAEVAPRLLNYPRYGLMTVDQVDKEFRFREAPRIVMRAKALHKFPIDDSVYTDMLYRMGSELASLSGMRLRTKEPEIESDLPSEQA